MKMRSARCVAVLAVVGILLTGCSRAPGGERNSPGKPLQLRLVTASTEETCNATPLMSDRAASACDREGATTYELGPSLGSITPTSVTLSKDQQPARSIVLEFDESDAETLGKVSQQAVDKQLAILFEGRVLSAPLVREPITDGRFMMAFGSSSQAQKITKALKATTPSGP